MSMQSRIYEILRRVHLYAGLSLLVFVVMYFVTGYVLIHTDLFPGGEPAVTQRQETLEAPLPAEGEAAFSALAERFGLRGKRVGPREESEGRRVFVFQGVGRKAEATVGADGLAVSLREEEGDARAGMIGLHRLHGYGGGWFYTLWAVVYDLASVAMIVFALSGIYMWYVLKRKHALGWVVLAASFGYSGAVIGYLLLAK